MPGKINVDGVKITQARTLLGKAWTQAKLAEEMTRQGYEFSRDQIANIESGRTKKMQLGELRVLAAILKKPIEHFSTDIPIMGVIPMSEEEKGIPIVGVVSAAMFNFSFDMPAESHLPVKPEKIGGKRTVALRVSGDCMVNPANPQKSLYDGDYVIIMEQDTCPDRTIAVIRLNGEYTLKRVFKVADGYELRPDNPKCPSIVVKSGDDMAIVGVFRGKFTPP